jgi:menaquinone-dependent protoporphyrinogen IX oxidase
VIQTQSIAERIALHLKEAATLRRIARVLTLRQARATVVQAAIAHEQAAAALAAT